MGRLWFEAEERRKSLVSYFNFASSFFFFVYEEFHIFSEFFEKP